MANSEFRRTKKMMKKASKKSAKKIRKRPTARRLSADTKFAVLLEAGWRCANPTCRFVLTLELHHIEWVKDGGGNSPTNLLALCRNCHGLHTSGHLPKDAIVAWKSMLLTLNNPHQASVDLLLYLRSEELRVQESTDSTTVAQLPRFTGDSLPFLAGLFNSGVLEISRRMSGFTMGGPTMPSFEVALTAVGRSLVDSWRSGSLSGVQGVLERPRAGSAI